MQVAKRTPETMGREFKRQKLVPGPRKKVGTATVLTRKKEERLINEHAVDEVKERVIRKVAGENAVVVVGGRGCCMCHVVKLLLLGLGANPLVYEVKGDEGRELAGVGGGDDSSSVDFPVVFIGGEMAGGMEWLMAAHISGELVPLLKKAGALWL